VSNPYEQEPEMSEKTLPTGEVITIARESDSIRVDCWDKDGNNRWSKLFYDQAKAQAEYDRWN